MSVKEEDKMSANMFSYDEREIKAEMLRLFSNDHFLEVLSNINFTVFRFYTYDYNKEKALIFRMHLN
jgi:hypothetical protein